MANEVKRRVTKSEKQQEAFIDFYCNNPFTTFSAVAQALNIDKRVVWNWRHNNSNGFNDKLDAKLQEKWAEAKHSASETMFELAEQGNFQAAKYILDYSGFQPKQEVKVEGDSIKINIE